MNKSPRIELVAAAIVLAVLAAAPRAATEGSAVAGHAVPGTNDGVVPNSGAGADLIVPIEAGTPGSLILEPGAYWAAWQVDTMADIPSYTAGALGVGFCMPMGFGPPPASLESAEITLSAEAWTEYLTYRRLGGATPTPTVDLGVRIEVPAQVHPGDDFAVTAWLDNPGPALAGVPVFFILDVCGETWFWDDWTHFDPETGAGIDFVALEVPPGSTPVEVVPALTWPDTGPDSAQGLRFWGAMLTQDMSGFIGEIAIAVWGCGP